MLKAFDENHFYTICLMCLKIPDNSLCIQCESYIKYVEGDIYMRISLSYLFMSDNFN